jgi:hypothetical protein
MLSSSLSGNSLSSRSKVSEAMTHDLNAEMALFKQQQNTKHWKEPRNTSSLVHPSAYVM